MRGIDIILLFMALSGFLPLVVFLIRKNRAEKILACGQIVNAIIFHISSGYKHNYEIVHYYFLANGQQYKGKLTTKPGAHRLNDSIEVHYLVDNPRHNTVKGTWKSTGFLIFMIIIAIAVLWMTYKLYQEVEARGI